ncbi:ABC transporter substrate-binding protein [Flavobacterium columnare NBRC 100251 = ATCC 23463]|uniref:Nitrate/sulfonate/bicarbonate ABC transporter periplasmic components-like protein n=1 Tax=Flavobacterium columnare (strain ATCC 49512 / CIP 103533 / TG 44/87) TaxID=1041826 RepID=G8XA28_FLACA|nr:substrate-binding domain-containing protein [Flavobacterium columnare]AEW85192.1 nitrate/sulfonate/bicarbonate ABC transporter periplasmic components-like protein [Flavobacterium columnare ATCC 49512]ANO49028.1 nitrate/sulfonate/bicarbonate ABC transporter periplasmic components-like protein [Flavobacterium columnare]APT22965.1 ABC transporter substrate-binding protein [Flavobacterium columnare]MBF6653479.1 ABC transporter substrate-binding protein [Flavobacterium columnare]MBF6656080.1 ABC
MKTVKIVGVPEHFNLPWQLCIENGEYDQVGIDLQWTDIPEGTGKMCQMLRNNEADIAVILTEGIIKDLASNNHSSIVQWYVQSPLIWGIHVNGSSRYKQLSDLENTTSAISRIGSGSHLMSFVNAKQQNWDLNKLNFDVVNTIDGAVESLQKGNADYFLWERFMTQPLVDQGIFRRIGECPTPWPSFVIAVRNEFLENNLATLELILEIINNTTIEFKDIPSIDRTLAARYNQKLEDIQQWLKQTRWSQKKIDQKTFNRIQNQLLEFNLIENELSFEMIVK